MIIKGNFIYAPSLEKLEIREQQYLLTEDGKVKGFHKTLPEEFTDRKVTDYGQAVIIPAFNDLHIHAPQYVNRGVGFDRELLPWLETYTFPVEAKYAEKAFAEKGYRLFLRSLWEAGTMRFSAFATLHKEASWHLMELCEASGLRGYIGKVNMDRNGPDYLTEDTDRSLADTEELAVRCAEELKYVRYIVTPRFVPSVTEKLMDGLGCLAEKYDLPVQSHLSENKGEIQWVRELHPQFESYTDVYDGFGLLRKDRTIMAHCIHLTEKEKDLLAEKNIRLAHCAQSNVDLVSGVMPLRKNLERGLNCIAASDLAGSHTLKMNRHIAMTVEVSKLRQMQYPEEKALSLAEALYLATKKPGEFFGKVGSFEEGDEFDALVIETDEMGGMLPRTPFEKLEQFIYDGDDRNILARYCGGEKIEKPFGSEFESESGSEEDLRISLA